MVLKAWSFIIGGILVGVGGVKHVRLSSDIWMIFVVIGIVTLLIAGIQTLYDYGDPKGWWIGEKKNKKAKSSTEKAK